MAGARPVRIRTPPPAPGVRARRRGAAEESAGTRRSDAHRLLPPKPAEHVHRPRHPGNAGRHFRPRPRVHRPVTPAWMSAAVSALAGRLGLEPGPQRLPQRLSRVRQAVLVVIPPEIPACVVREVDGQSVVITDHRLRGAYCPASDRVTHPDLAEAEPRVRVLRMQFPEIRGPGPDTR